MSQGTMEPDFGERGGKRTARGWQHEKGTSDELYERAMMANDWDDNTELTEAEYLAAVKEAAEG